MDKLEEVEGIAFEIPLDIIQLAEAENRWVDAQSETDSQRVVDYAVIDPGTGEIKRAGTCQFKDLPLQPQQGEAVLALEVTTTHQQSIRFDVNGPKVVDIAPPPPPVDADQVRVACRRRMFDAYPIEAQFNALYDGYEAEMRQWIETMRERCAKLIAMEPIPQDYDTDKRWPKAPASARKQEPEE